MLSIWAVIAFVIDIIIAVGFSHKDRNFLQNILPVIEKLATSFFYKTERYCELNNKLTVYIQQYPYFYRNKPRQPARDTPLTRLFLWFILRLDDDPLSRCQMFMTIFDPFHDVGRQLTEGGPRDRIGVQGSRCAGISAFADALHKGNLSE